MTVNALRAHLESLSTRDCSFSIAKVERDRAFVRADHLDGTTKKRSLVILPAYPTGWKDDDNCKNLNVVLDPLKFEGVESCSERHVFEPLLGHDVLEQYEKTHPDSVVPMSRCC